MRANNPSDEIMPETTIPVDHMLIECELNAKYDRIIVVPSLPLPIDAPCFRNIRGLYSKQSVAPMVRVADFLRQYMSNAISGD